MPDPVRGTLEGLPIDALVETFKNLGMRCFQTQGQFQSCSGAEQALEGQDSVFPDELRVAFDHQAFKGLCLEGQFRPIGRGNGLGIEE